MSTSVVKNTREMDIVPDVETLASQYSNAKLARQRRRRPGSASASTPSETVGRATMPRKPKGPNKLAQRRSRA